MELRLSLRQTQRMIMTQSLQQAIGLLQLSRMELLQAVSQEVEENPLLEEELLEDGQLPAEGTGEGKEGEEEGERSEDPLSDFDWESYLQDASDYRREFPRRLVFRGTPNPSPLLVGSPSLSASPFHLGSGRDRVGHRDYRKSR